VSVPELSIVCGMTETSPISTQVLPDDPGPACDQTVGRPTPHVEVKVVDPATGETLGVGRTGEQCTRGYSVMQGYWNNPQATEAAIDSDGWMHTGDLATLDPAGYLTLVGRLTDVIIRGGENIYPVEIEELLRTHPGVKDAYVVGIPDDRLGEQVMAWVSLHDEDDTETTDADLTAFCAARLSRSKVPSHWRFTTTFPTTASGKVQKFELRRMALESAPVG
jgi:fatty-acyl-CoA synthase